MSRTVERYKKCPVCGAVNDEFEAICSNCFVDISSVAAAFAPDGGGGADSVNETAVVICPKCGAVNPDYSQLCDNCGEDISGAAREAQSGGGKNKDGAPGSEAVAKSSAVKAKRIFLFSKEENIAVELFDGMIFGRCDSCSDEDERKRMNCPEAAGKKKFIDCVKFDTVSRAHARIICAAGEYYIIALPESKNMTKLNDTRLIRGSEYKLSHGDTLYFSKKLKLKVFIK